MRGKFLILILTVFTLVIFPTNAAAVPQVLGKKEVHLDVNVGKIEEVKRGKVGIENKGKKVEITTSEKTTIIEKPNGNKIAPGQLKKGDHVATFANPDATGSANLILVKPKSATDSAKPESRRRAVYGLVRQINGNILLVSHPIKDSPRYNVAVSDGTVIKIKGVENATIGNVKVGDRIAAVGLWAGDNLVAKKVHVIPGKAIGLLEKGASGSATPFATPSASISPSATVEPSASL